MHDDLYPNEGDYFIPKEPEAQTNERAKENIKIKAARGFITDMLKRFDERIAFYDSLDSIKADIDADPATFQKIHAANKLTKENLITEREWVLALQAQIKS